MEGTVASVPPQGGRKHPQQELIQIDTTNILFICGGAFDGLEKIIETRKDESTIGFNGFLKSNTNLSRSFKSALPQDFVKFGLIPEFIGRVPITVALDELDKEALVRIITEPKNSLTKQYQKLFELDDVQLTFDEDAIDEIAEASLKRATGARGLRAIMENIMLDIMYKIPSDDSIKKYNITKEIVKERLKEASQDEPKFVLKKTS